MRREIASNARAKWMAVCTVALAAACANSNPGGEESTSTQGLALKMEIGAKTGITGMHFVVQAVDCASGEALPGSDPISTDKALDELMLPGGTPELMDNPLDKASTHAFADAFFTLAAGCYDVTTTPATTAGMVCHSAMKSKVAVTAGKTTEIFLLNQCDGKDPGALDVIAATNHPPVLLDVSFKTSKFVKTCADQVVCATAQDPENDKLEFVWTKDASGPAIQGPFAEGTTKVNADGSLTQCVRFVPQAAGMVSLTATVYDVAHNSAGTVRIEDWLAAEGYPNPSHASLSLPSYSTGDMAPATEICTDGIDNDCDGLADAEDVDDCYTGIPDDGCPPGLVPVCDKSPLDIALLQDLTGSFGDDIVTLRSLAPNLVAALNAASTDVRLGDVSFRDKPYAPFGDAGDYVYQPRLALETPGAGFLSVINSLVTGGGYDTSEAQLSALCLTAENATGPTIGFRSDAAVKRFAILVTDAPFHLAPDCVTMAYSPVCTGPYVADGVDDPSEDYPTQDQAIAVLNAANITPVFAVTSWTTSYYQGLVDALGRGKVVTLASDSSNIMDAIFAGLGTECTCKAP